MQVGAILCDGADAGGSAAHQADDRASADRLGRLKARLDFCEVRVERVDGNFRGAMVEHDIPAVRTVDVRIQVGDLAVHRREHEVECFAVGVSLRRADVDAFVEALAVFTDHAE